MTEGHAGENDPSRVTERTGFLVAQYTHQRDRNLMPPSSPRFCCLFPAGKSLKSFMKLKFVKELQWSLSSPPALHTPERSCPGLTYYSTRQEELWCHSWKGTPVLKGDATPQSAPTLPALLGVPPPHPVAAFGLATAE